MTGQWLASSPCWAVAGEEGRVLSLDTLSRIRVGELEIAERESKKVEGKMKQPEL